MVTSTRIKIWIKMIFGKSDLHRPQDVGRYFSCEEIKGYYNDLTGKVLFDKKNIDNLSYVPTYKNDYGDIVHFPISIIQYGLGCIDLFFKTNDEKFLKKAKTCANYIIGLIDEDGAIDCMFFVKGLKNTNSSMCQGEAISLFARMFTITQDNKYLVACDKLYNFLCNTEHAKKVSKYGTKGLQFYEYPDKALVLNGYIFSIFGIFDYYLLKRSEDVKKVFENSIDELSNLLDSFVFNEWSYYDLDRNIASKFYHSLHINLLTALESISKKDFSKYINIFLRGLKSKKTRTKMFWKKAKQKIKG